MRTKSTTITALAALAAWAGATAGCADSAASRDTGTDADTDADADADSDADTDSDADSDADADADGDTDADTDSGTDSGSDSGSDADADGDSDTDADGDADTDVDTDADGDTDGDTDCVQYSHTIAIDGTNDFDAGEIFATTTGGYAAYAAWDGDYLYLGLSGGDVAAGSATRWVLVYVGGAPGTGTGVAYNTQQPGLPFSARYHVRWRTDNGYTGAMEWSGSAWEDAGWDFAGDAFQSGEFVELRLPRADLGDPATLRLALAMINELADYEGTYAGCPDDTFSDGYDRDFATWLQFDMDSCDPPAVQD